VDTTISKDTTVDTGEPTDEATESVSPQDTTRSAVTRPAAGRTGDTSPSDGETPAGEDEGTEADQDDPEGPEPEDLQAAPTEPEPADQDDTESENLQAAPTEPEPADQDDTESENLQTTPTEPEPTDQDDTDGPDGVEQEATGQDAADAQPMAPGEAEPASSPEPEEQISPDRTPGEQPRAEDAAQIEQTSDEEVAEAGDTPSESDVAAAADSGGATPETSRSEDREEPAGTVTEESPAQQDFSLFEKPPAPPTVPISLPEAEPEATEAGSAASTQSTSTAPEITSPSEAQTATIPIVPAAPGKAPDHPITDTPDTPQPPDAPQPPSGSQPPAPSEAQTATIPIVPASAPVTKSTRGARWPSRSRTEPTERAVVPDRLRPPTDAAAPPSPTLPSAPTADTPRDAPEPSSVGATPGHPVSRRTALWAGAAAVATAALAGGGLMWWRTASRGGRPLRGAGWKDPFLTDGDQAQHWWGGSDVTFETTFTPLSGSECLTLDEAAIRRLDFVTCPNGVIADAMQERVRSVLGRPPMARQALCTGSFVVMVHWEMLGSLSNAGVLVRPTGVSAGARFDLNRYLQVCTDQWGEYDRYLTTASNRAIALDNADPLTTTSGQALLAALDDARDDKDHSEDSGFPTSQSLWHSGTSATGENPSGPLTRKTASDDSRLVQELLAGDRQMVYVDETLALRTVLGEGKTDYVVLRTVPEATYTRYLLVLTEEAEILGRRIVEPKIAKSLAERWIRGKGQEAEISGRVHTLGLQWESALTDVQVVSWKDRALSLDELDVSPLLDKYRKSRS
jgi:hypothetical protein